MKLKLFRKKEKASKFRVNRSLLGNSGILIFLILICAFMALPMVYSVLQSFKPYGELFAYPPKFYVKNPTLDSYRQVFQLADSFWVPFSRYAFNSIFITLIGTIAYIVVSALAAYPLAKEKFPGNALISSLIVWTLMFNAEVTATPRYIIVSKLKLLDSYAGMILPAMAGTLGVFLMKQFMQTAINDSTLEAARIDGANEYTIFYKIALPCIKPATLTLMIFSFQTFWGATSSNYIYSETLKGIPSVLSSIAGGGIARAGAGAAVTVLLMIPPIAVFLVSQSSIMDTMSHSGLK